MMNRQPVRPDLVAAALRAAYKISGGKAGEPVTCQQIAQHVRITQDECRQIVGELRSSGYVRNSGDDTCVVIIEAGFQWLKRNRFPVVHRT